MAFRHIAVLLISASQLFLSYSISAQPDPRIVEWCEGNESLAKLGGSLLQVRKAVKENKSTPTAAFQTYLPHSVRDGGIQCIIAATAIEPGLLAACESAGLDVVGTYELPGAHHVVVTCSDPAQLEGLAARSDVVTIAPEPKMITNVGSVSNQADASIHADDVRSAFGFDGSGFRIGVLSDSVNQTIGGSIVGGILTGSGPQVSGDLPPQIRVVDPGPSGGSDEGAGMMELIHDLAPGCALSFASASSGYSPFASNIAGLVSDLGFPCDILVDDVFYYTEPVYQDGYIALAVDAAFAAGVPYFSSAGNQAGNAYEHTYVDAVPGVDDLVVLPTGNDLHDFGLSIGASSDRFLTITLDALGEVDVLLKWDEPGIGFSAPGSGSESDLNLFLTVNENLPLVDADPSPGVSNPPFDNVIAQGNDIQGATGSPSGEPFEFVSYTNPSNMFSEVIYVAIEHVKGREPVEIYLQILGSGIQSVEPGYTVDRTILGHAAAADGLAVAAMFYGEIDSGGSLDAPTGVLNVEPFSSLGGNLPIYFSADGMTRLGVPEIRFKPEITAPDGSNTTFFGGDIGFDADTDPNFFGTSAAAPHAAAVAGLMLSANPGLTASEVYSLMRSSAIDSETPGPDFLSGDGLVDALQAVLATNPVLPASNANWDLYR